MDSKIAKEVVDRDAAIAALKNTLLGEGAQDTLDTFAEIAEWISENGTVLETLGTDVATLKTDVADLKAEDEAIHTTVDPVVEAFPTVKDAVDILTADEETEGSVDYKVAALEAQIKALKEEIESISVWMEFTGDEDPSEDPSEDPTDDPTDEPSETEDEDAPVQDDSYVLAASVAEIEEMTSEEAAESSVEPSDEAMEYFESESSNYSTKTFKNITIK